MAAKLTEAQRGILLHISDPRHHFPDMGKPRMWRATLDRLSALGLAAYAGPHPTEIRSWRITPAGRAALGGREDG